MSSDAPMHEMRYHIYLMDCYGNRMRIEYYTESEEGIENYKKTLKEQGYTILGARLVLTA